MTISAISREVQQWFETPINCKKEKAKLLIITAVVIAALALGTVFYHYAGSIPGYNLNYSYLLWTVGTGIALGATIVYLIRKILSKEESISIKGASKERNRAFKAELGKNEGIQWLTQKMTSPITLLSPEEESAPPFVNLRQSLYSNEQIDHSQLFKIFKDKESSFLAGLQTDTSCWFIAARIELAKADRTLDGICLMTQNKEVSDSWWVYCNFFGLPEEEKMRCEFQEITHNFPDAPLTCHEFLWIKNILEGKERGAIPQTPNIFVEDRGKGVARLWSPTPFPP